MFDSPENIELNGRILYIDYATAQEMKNETSKNFGPPFKYVISLFLYLHICFGFHVYLLSTVNGLFTEHEDGAIRRGHSEPSSTLFLQNLLFETTEDDLKKAFDGCVRAKIVGDPTTGRSRG